MIIKNLFALGRLLPILLVLAACGFHPVYGSHNSESGSPVAVALNSVAIDNIADRPGQILRNDLIDRMYVKGRPSLPTLTLSVKIRNTEEDLGILTNATATRSLMNTYGDYQLKDRKGTVLVWGTAHSTTSFDKLNDIYGTLTAREDAYQRTLNEVSEQIVNRLSLYFSEHPTP